MAHLKQIVYELESYGEIGTISTNKEKNGIVSSTDNSYEAKKINMLENILGEGERCIKIGIQAPPGTKFFLNNTKEIFIGRNGIYELDQRTLDYNNSIVSLKFASLENLNNIIIDYIYE